MDQVAIIVGVKLQETTVAKGQRPSRLARLLSVIFPLSGYGRKSEFPEKVSFRYVSLIARISEVCLPGHQNGRYLRQ